MIFKNLNNLTKRLGIALKLCRGVLNTLEVREKMIVYVKGKFDPVVFMKEWRVISAE